MLRVLSPGSHAVLAPRPVGQMSYVMSGDLGRRWNWRARNTFSPLHSNVIIAIDNVSGNSRSIFFSIDIYRRVPYGLPSLIFFLTKRTNHWKWWSDKRAYRGQSINNLSNARLPGLYAPCRAKPGSVGGLTFILR